MTMSTAVVSSDRSASWFKPQYWWACVRGRLRTSLKPRVLYVHAGLSCAEQEWVGVAQSFAAWCADHVGETCMLGLSSRWLLNGLVSADLDEQDAMAQVVQQWSHYMDVDAASLQADWILRQVSVGGQHLLCAAPSALIEALKNVAEERGVRLLWVGPWWARAVQTWLSTAGTQTAETATVSTLQAREPGLITNVEASFSQGKIGQIQRIWVEASDGEMAVSTGAVVELASPRQLGIERRPHHTHVWDQAQIAAALRGERAMWEALR